MKKLFSIVFVLLLALAANAADIVTATISVTNSAGTTNGQTITVNANVRTWTNNVFTPATMILTNTTAEKAATNMFTQFSTYPFSGLSLSRTTSTNVTLQTQPGGNITVTISDGWGAVSYSTQLLVSATVVRVPMTVESLGQRTNIASGLVSWIGSDYDTNQIPQGAPAFPQFLGTSNTQTIYGNKTFLGVLGATNEASNVSIGNVTATNFSGTVGVLIGGLFGIPILDSPVFTNAVNKGSAFSSIGTALSSEQFGSSAQASGLRSLAIGPSATASGNDSTAAGYNTTASYPSATAIGASAKALNTNAIAIGKGAFVTHSNSVAIGTDATSTAENQVLLGGSGQFVEIGGSLLVRGALTNFSSVGTNTYLAGADISFTRYAVSSLANGNNAAVPVGTNVFIEVSGPSSAFTINGLNAAGAIRDGKLVVIVNQTGFDMTIAHQSGTDPAAANRIISMTGADRTTTGNGSATLIYSGAASRWLLVSFDP